MSILKEHDFPFKSFIGGWYIPPKICSDLIKFYNDKKNNKHKIDGMVWNESKLIVNKNVKESRDLPIDHDMMNKNKCVLNYFDYLQLCLNNYVDKYSELNRVGRYTIVERAAIQKYPKGGGFKDWHCERSDTTNHRVLVFMTYLNTVKNAGTEFKYLDIASPCVQGLTILWPSEWTHVHRGIVSKTKEKIIITGWYNYI
jgi:hypothetical protein